MTKNTTVRGWWQRSVRWLSMLGAAGALALSGCGGSSLGTSASSSATGGTGATTSSTGTALVSITDLPGDFLTYLVKVVSLKLTRADGTVVETVPNITQIDFTQLVSLSEVLSARQIPSGEYVSASMTLDYSGATIVVDNGAGGVTVLASNIINGNTSSALVSPNNEVTLSLSLPSSAPLVITDRTVSNLALDFNLAASNTVAPNPIGASTPASSVTVTVNPTLTASLAPDTTKQLRVRGSLVSVTDTASSTAYTVNLRPFDNDSGTQGQLVVNTTTTTAFTINGTSYTGNAGLAALAALATGTLTAATGSYDSTTRMFTATTVLAGTSTPGLGTTGVSGTILSRTDNTLTLSRGLICRSGRGDGDSSALSGAKVIVTVAATTAVTADGQTGSFGLANLSVGQRVQITGTLGTDSSGNTTLDATNGTARLMVTGLWGLFAAASGKTVTVNLKSLGGQPASAFDFAGTGTSTAQDAVATAYTVNVASDLTLPTISAGAPVQFSGFVAPYQGAPPDFNATEFASFAATDARLRIEWALPGLTAPFVSPLSASNVALSQATLQAAVEHLIQIGPERLDPSALASGLSLVANSAATSPQLAIVHWMSRKEDSFTSFSTLIGALGTDLNGTTSLLRLAADGSYDGTTGVFSVSDLVAVLDD